MGAKWWYALNTVLLIIILVLLVQRQRACPSCVRCAAASCCPSETKCRPQPAGTFRLIIDHEGQPSVEDEGQPSVEDEGEPSVEDEGQPSVEDEGEPSVEDEGQPSVEDEGQPSVEDERWLPLQSNGCPVYCPKLEQGKKWLRDKQGKLITNDQGCPVAAE